MFSVLENSRKIVEVLENSLNFMQTCLYAPCCNYCVLTDSTTRPDDMLSSRVTQPARLRRTQQQGHHQPNPENSGSMDSESVPYGAESYVQTSYY